MHVEKRDYEKCYVTCFCVIWQYLHLCKAGRVTVVIIFVMWLILSLCVSLLLRHRPSSPGKAGAAAADIRRPQLYQQVMKHNYHREGNSWLSVNLPCFISLLLFWRYPPKSSPSLGICMVHSAAFFFLWCSSRLSNVIWWFAQMNCLCIWWFVCYFSKFISVIFDGAWIVV